MLVVKVALPGALFLWYLRRGAFPELRQRPSLPGALADVAYGVLIAALWMGPFLLFPELPRPEPADGFDPDQLGEGSRGFVLGVRLLGFAGVTPFVEELFVRSFVLRLSDVARTDMNIGRVPMARFTWPSFLVTVVWFTFTHVSWEWGVAFVAGILFKPVALPARTDRLVRDRPCRGQRRDLAGGRAGPRRPLDLPLGLCGVEEGRSAGRASVAAADALDELDQVDDRLAHRLGRGVVAGGADAAGGLRQARVAELGGVVVERFRRAGPAARRSRRAPRPGGRRAARPG